MLRIHAMVGGLWNEKSLFACSHIFDRYTMKVTVQNCTIDLAKQTPYDFLREDYLTKQAPVRY